MVNASAFNTERYTLGDVIGVILGGGKFFKSMPTCKYIFKNLVMIFDLLVRHFRDL